MSLLQQIRTVFTPPQFESTDKTYRTYWLYKTLLVFFLLSITYSIFLLVGLPRANPQVHIYPITAILITLVLLFLLRRRLVNFVNWFLLSLLFVCCIWIATNFYPNTINTATLGFFLLVPLAWFLLGKQYALPTIAVIAITLATINFSNNNSIRLTNHAINWLDWSIFTCIIIFAYLLQKANLNLVTNKLRFEAEKNLAQHQAQIKQLRKELEVQITKRKKSEFKYRSLFANDQTGIITTNTNFSINEVNPTMCNWLGYSKDEMCQMSIGDITVPEDVELSKELAKQVFQRKIPSFQMEKKYKGKDGGVVNALTTVGATFDEQGNYIENIAVITNITDKKKAEEKLIESEVRFRTIFEQSSLGMSLLDIDSKKFTRVNQAFCQMLGYSVDELQSLTLTDITYSDDLKVSLELTEEKEYLEGKSSGYTLEKRYIRKDNSLIWVRVNAVVLRDLQNNPTDFLGIIEDITEQKQIQEDFIEEKNLLQNLIDAMPNGIFLKDSKGNYQIYNEFLKSLSPHSNKAILTDHDLFPDEKQILAIQAEDQQVISSRKSLSKEMWINRDGKDFCLYVTKTPLINSEGKVLGVIGANLDITKQKKVQEELQQERTLLRNLIDAIPSIVVFQDTESRYQIYNKALKEFHNCSDGVFTDYDFFPAELAEKNQKENKQVMASKKRLQKKVWFPMHNGGKRFLDIIKTPFIAPNGEVLGIISAAHDITDLKQTEEALQHEHAFLHNLIDAVPVNIQFKDCEGNYKVYNQSARDFPNISGKTVVTDHDFFPEETVKVIREEDQYIMVTREKVHKEIWVPTSNGQKRRMDVNKAPFIAPNGEVLGVISIANDITELKQTQEALQRERTFLNHLIDTIPSVIFYQDTESQYQLLNKTMREFPNFPEKVITDYDIFPAEVAKVNQEEDRYVIANKQNLRKEGWVSILGGEKRFLETIKTPFIDSNDEVIGIIGVAHDITELKRIQETVEQEHALLQNLIDAIPSIVLFQDTEGHYQLYNKALKEFHNCFDKIDTDYDFFPVEVAEANEKENELVLASRKSLNKKAWFANHGGEKVFMDVIKTPFIAPNGEVLGIINTAYDITKLKQAEEALQHERAFLNHLIDTIPSVIFYQDTDSNYQLYNKAMREFPNFPKEVITNTDYDFFPAEIAKANQEEDKHVITNKKNFRKEGWFSMLGGEKRFMEIVKTPFIDSNGEVIGIIGVAHDTTKSKAYTRKCRTRTCLFTKLN